MKLEFSRHRLLAALLLLSVLLLPGASGAAAEPPHQHDFFEQEIRPVLVRHCYACHSAEAAAAGKLKGGLRLDSREAARTGGDSGPAVVPGDPDASLLVEALRYETFQMPPDGQLATDVIRNFERWVKSGADDPRDEGTPPSHAALQQPSPADHWAFSPPTRHGLPRVSHPAWLQQPIDAFIAARLDAEGLSPNPPAARRTLVRRLYFDLLGLPPAPADVDAFVADETPGAFERLVDRLLASPHYGERWGRLWLDVARYAEDQAHIVGNNRELCYPNAFLYRDWVIKALNGDLRYDEFVRLQLAADLLSPSDPHNLVALGFIGLGPKYYRRNALEVMADEWEDRVDVVGRGLLGLTVACARCHDHKYDPIPTEDYYALAGVFASTEMFNRPRDESAETGKNGQAKEPESALHIIRDAQPHDLHVHIRGDVQNQGEVVPRGFVQVLSGAADGRQFREGSGRQDLAAAITDRNNPLTARVIVNRIWALHFGRPIVGSQSNFGRLGEAPTHPDLLDDLAVRFMEHGWSLKWLHREILLSSAWQQSSLVDAHSQRIDPANRLLWRMPRRRLNVEGWRDTLLAVCGQLDSQIGGPSIDPQDPTQRRRTVYSQVSRLDLNPLLAMFDFPDPNVHAASRVETTTALQKLFVLNSPFMVEHAAALAERSAAGRSEIDDRIDWLYATLFSRTATSDERQLAIAFLGPDDTGRPVRWQQYCQILLASNELLVMD